MELEKLKYKIMSDQLSTDIKLSEKQNLAYNLMVQGKNIFLTGPGGTGKCLGKDTPVIMYNGEVKMIQNIKQGELVMGDDSTPRNVLSITSGTDEMYRVKTGKGDSYIVNSCHILTFQVSKSISYNKRKNRYVLIWGDISGVVKSKHFENKEDAEKYNDKIPSLIDIPILECIENSKKKYWLEYFQGVYKGIDFTEQDVKIDPYMMGLWLGDVTSVKPLITNIDREIIVYLENFCSNNGFILKQRNPNTRDKINYYISDPRFLDILREYNVYGNKHIPLIYKVNSREKRLQLLAGLIDSDGYLGCGVYEINQKRKILADDIYFLAKSLGFQVKSCMYKDKKRVGTYYRLYISGNMTEIPVLLKRKKASQRKQIKNHMVSEITIEHLGKDEYYGFELDGNHRFLLGNFLVTHNTAVIKTFIKVYKQNKIMGVTSTTGISALLFGGVTLHSFLGIGLGQGSAESIVGKLFKRSHFRKRWNELEVLIIDEISMLSPDLFDKLEYVARRIRHNEAPFGGIQLILSGDYCQLPCINSDNFCFESKSWTECVEETVYLTEIMRQKNIDFQECLNNIRLGYIPKKTRKLLNTRVGVELKNDFGIKPTKIFSTNYSVDYINNKELDALAVSNPDFYEYNMEVHVYPGIKDRESVIEKYKKNCNAPETLQLCVGAQVMLLWNLDTENGLVNGSRGVVTSFIRDIPMVKFLIGRELLIDYNIWEHEEQDKKILRIVQIPLKLAYAITVHKCVNENTLIYTETGIKRIKKISTDLFPEQNFGETKETSIGIIGKNGLKTATQIYKGIIEDTYIITTSLGYRLEGSYKHPLLTYDGEEKWVKLPQIKIGDFLTLKIGSNCYGKNIKTESFVSCYIPELVEEKLCYLIGLLIGDRCYKNIVAKYVEYFFKIFGKKCKIYDDQKKHIREFLQWCGLDYVKSGHKTIPWVVLENTRKSQIYCLKGLFDSNGGVNNNTVHFTTTSHQLALDMQNILLNLGIIASLKESNGDSRKTTYRLHLTGYQAHLYYKFIGFEDVEKQRKLTEKYAIYTLNTVKSNICEVPNGDKLVKDFREEIYKFYDVTKRCNNLPKDYMKVLSKIIHGNSKLRWQHIISICTILPINIEQLGPSGKKLMDLYKNGIFFDKVVDIQKSKSQLYDLYLPEDHTFVGNGIINHNSQGCSLDYAEIDLSNIFAPGQSYVALSRVTNIEGLSILDIDFDQIKAHPKAVAFYEELLS